MNLVVRDNLWPNLVSAVNTDWPAADWPGWIDYDPATQCKRASDLTSPLPPSCGLILARIAELPVSEWFGEPLLPDLGLWGAGLHEMPHGTGLARHLDADTHPRLRLQRVLSAVLWVHGEWLPEWGGELVLDGGVMLRPAPGRLCILDCRTEPHRVEPVRCPAGVTRRSLAMFWYALQPGKKERMRSCFERAN